MIITCGRLISLWFWLTIFTLAGASALSLPDGQRHGMTERMQVGLWLAAGLTVGCIVASLQRHPRRILGLIPFGATGLCIGLLLLALGFPLAQWLCVFLGGMWAWISIPFPAAYPGLREPDGPMGWYPQIIYFYLVAVATGMTGLITFALAYGGTNREAWVLWSLAAMAGLAAALAWWYLFREQMELVLEIVLWPFYRVRAHGPGVKHFPPRGPVLVVANHSAWLDPLWLAKVLPRRLIPMMTSVFYDLPVMRWLMVHVAYAIRVQASTFRREAPELAVAIAALDRGECVVIFPEGQMRRREKAPLRQFGQGVWHILSERPDTPVVICWIEGGWGCFFSYFNGKPTKNKRMDFWRPIDVAVGPCRKLSPDLLQDQRSTRSYLMQECLQARSYLGMPPLNLDNGMSNLSAAEDKGTVSADDIM